MFGTLLLGFRLTIFLNSLWNIPKDKFDVLSIGLQLPLRLDYNLLNGETIVFYNKVGMNSKFIVVMSFGLSSSLFG